MASKFTIKQDGKPEKKIVMTLDFYRILAVRPDFNGEYTILDKSWNQNVHNISDRVYPLGVIPSNGNVEILYTESIDTYNHSNGMLGKTNLYEYFYVVYREKGDSTWSGNSNYFVLSDSDSINNIR